jgi:hypothetical protein
MAQVPLLFSEALNVSRVFVGSLPESYRGYVVSTGALNGRKYASTSFREKKPWKVVLCAGISLHDDTGAVGRPSCAVGVDGAACFASQRPPGSVSVIAMFLSIRGIGCLSFCMCFRACGVFLPVFFDRMCKLPKGVMERWREKEAAPVFPTISSRRIGTPLPSH